MYLDLDVGDPNRPEAGEVADVFTSAAGGKENENARAKKEKGVNKPDNVAATRASAGRTVTLPAFPSDAELARAVGDANEGLLIVSSGIASFCGFENPETARAFDEQMRVALEAESHFCGAGASGVGRSCDIGFDIPRGVAEDRDCASMRASARDPEAFRQRYERIGRHQDSR